MQPWAPRFQKVLSLPPVKSENQLGQSLLSKTAAGVNECQTNVVDSPHPSKEEMELLVSPSPLVSWRGDCTIERGRQLFMLTPLPMSKVLSSKRQDISKSLFARVSSSTTGTLPCFLADPGDTNHEVVKGVAINPTPNKPFGANTGSTFECGIVSTPMFGKRDGSLLVMTPHLKMSPPKSCVLLEPISESSHQEKDKIKNRKSTPFPVGVQNSGVSELSDSSSNEAPDNLALKYPELFGIQFIHKGGIGRKEVESSPDWFLSPLKTCVLMDPSNEKSPKIIDPSDDVQGGCLLTNKYRSQGIFFSSNFYLLFPKQHTEHDFLSSQQNFLVAT